MSLFCVLKIEQCVSKNEVRQVLASMLGARSVKAVKRDQQLPSLNIKIKFQLRNKNKKAKNSWFAFFLGVLSFIIYNRL